MIPKAYFEKTIQYIAADTENVATDCTSVQFSNFGEQTVILQSGDTKLILQPEQIEEWNHNWDELEVTFFNKVYFEGIGSKNLRIVREYASETKPERKNVIK